MFRRSKDRRFVASVDSAVLECVASFLTACLMSGARDFDVLLGLRPRTQAPEE